VLVAAVETSHASGEFVVDERLRVDEVRLSVDDTIGTARLSVQIDDGFDAYDAIRRYHSDLRILIRVDEPAVAANTVLFEGYPAQQQSQWDGRVDLERDIYRFTAEHVYGRLQTAREAQVFGRWMRNAEIEDGLVADPPSYASASVLVTALPCEFNAGGVANCSPTPLTVIAPDGTTRSIHIFTDDNDPDAVPWTFATALRYLVWFGRPTLGPVGEGNIFAATDAIVSGADTSVDMAALVAALSAEPEGLDCEARNLVGALARLASAAGVHVAADTSEANGLPRTALRVWAADDGAVKWLHLARGGRDASGQSRYEVANRPAAHVLRDNDTYRATIDWDARRMRNVQIVLGGVKRYEVTLPLVPGWLPEENLDNVAPGDRAAAKALALTPQEILDGAPAVYDDPWYKTYHRNGADYGPKRFVSRLWVLNEHGRYGSEYERNAPFDSYAPFDFTTVLDASITGPKQWLRRGRRLYPPITTTEEGNDLPVWLEFSFDSGATWERLTAGAQVLATEVGVFLNVANPTSITPSDSYPDIQNLWYALVDQTLRVRVTGVIEWDDRLMHEPSPSIVDSPTVQVRASVAAEPSRYQFAVRSGTVDVLATVNPDAADIERDDAAAIAARVTALTYEAQDTAIAPLPALPWVESRIAVSDRIAGVRGRGLSFASRAGSTVRYPCVVGVRYRLSPKTGYETELLLEKAGYRS
jgi:hypothetical protein